MFPKKSISILILSLLISLTLFAFDTSEILWRYTTGGRITTPPVESSDGTIYFCSEDRFLYAINRNGELKWRTNLEDRITETLSLGYDGTIYAGSKRDYFLATNSKGEIIWKAKLKGTPVGSPAIKADGTLFIATTEGWFYSISHTGFIRWEMKLPDKPVSGPVIGIDVYIALNNERLYAFNMDGLRLWTFLLSGNAETIALTTDNIYVGTNNSTLVAIDYGGRKIWNKSLSGPVNSVIVLSEDCIVITHGYNITMLDSEGVYIWNKNERNLQIDLASYSNEIISLDSEGKISWFNFEGEIISQINGGLPSDRFLISLDGNIYLGSRDWLFYKYGSNELIKSDFTNYIWPSFRGGGENRGSLLTDTMITEKDEIIVSSDYLYFMESSKSLNEQVLNGILDEIEIRLFSREFIAGKSYLLGILENMAAGAVKNPLLVEGLLINDFPVIRSRAIDILGITGNFKTIDFLTDLLNFEWDDYVVRSIFRSLGNLQSNMDQVITNGIYNYYSTNKSSISQSYLSQILISVQKIKKYNGQIDRTLLSIITDIFLTSSSRNIKELALDIINSVKK
ncbi:MAG: PQQ-binding-like beta-propeller repeat protein [Spirochaetia bacterium]|nr:PQQ-binding-like beta-propeller repeat protein [Spirochaetia bacterium]